jgi:hypothetical protein
MQMAKQEIAVRRYANGWGRGWMISGKMFYREPTVLEACGASLGMSEKEVMKLQQKMGEAILPNRPAVRVSLRVLPFENITPTTTLPEKPGRRRITRLRSHIGNVPSAAAGS